MCTFGATHAVFLGHIVSSQGVHTDPGKFKLCLLLNTLGHPLDLQDIIDALFLILPLFSLPLFNLP